MNRREMMVGLGASGMLLHSAWGETMQTGVDAEVSRQIAPESGGKPIRLGIIGAGSRGKEVVRNFLRVPGVKIVAAADVYEPRFAQLNAVCGYEVQSHSDYRALCDRKDLDAVIVSTPLGLHGEHLLAALHAGHNVYGEKALAYHAEEAKQVVDAVSSTGKIFQVGLQYRYSPWIRAAVKRVQDGEIGRVTHVQAFWHRNNDWRRPVPANDPGGKLEQLINWRLYHRWSLGLMAELASHHLDLANWIFGENPETALASGSICSYHDGRETDDNVQMILSYSGGRRFIFSSMLNNAKEGDQLWIYGDKGSLNVTLEDATFYYEPQHKAAPAAAGVEKGVTTSASYQPGGEMPYRGAGKPVAVTTAEDPTTAATRAFIYCLRHDVQPISNVKTGYAAAMAVIAANQSRAAGKEIAILKA